MTIAGIGHVPARGLAGALFAATALFGLGAAAPSSAAAAQLNMSYVSTTTWTADPIEGRVHVSSSVVATSHAADANGLRGFYSTLEMTLPRSISDVSATLLDGTSRPVSVAGATSAGTVVSIALGRRLYAEDTASLVVQFDLVDAGGSTDRDIRIGHNIMSFPVQAFGSRDTPGSSVTVVFPADFTVQEDFGSLTRSIFATDQIVFTSGPLDDAGSLSAWFTAAQPVAESDLRSRFISVAGLSITLRYWVDDPGWADAVETVLARGLPMLRDLIGLGDPATRTLTVVEATSQDTGGYAGSLDVIRGQVQVSYLADPFVILHEAAHLWFNDSLAPQRWIEEGFASYYAERAVLLSGFVDHSPQLSPRLKEAAVPFNDWLTAGVPNSATEAYLYAATLQVARQIADAAGPTSMQKVWRHAAAGIAAYQPSAASSETQAGPIDWQRFLDLLESVTGQSYETIWNEWVVTKSQAPLLGQRLESRLLHTDVVAEAGTWTLPPEIRTDLDTWHFDQADDALAQARLVLSARKQIESLAAREQTSPPSTLLRLFETSTIQASLTEASAELQALDAISAASKAATNGVDAGGFLIGGDPEADLASARIAFAQGNLQSAVALAGNAERIWQGGYSAQLIRMIGLATGSIGLLGLLAIGLWALGRRPRGLQGLAASVGAASTEVAAVSHIDEFHVGDDAESIGSEALPAFDGDGLESVPILAASRRTNRGGSGSGGFGEGGSAGAGGSGGGSGADGPESGRLAPEPNPFGPDFDTEAAEREESAYALLRRGQALLRDRHNAQAAVVLERASRVEPGKGSILEALGRAYFNSGQHVRAAETFEALLEVDPSAHYGHFALGMSFARLGREQEARTHLRLAVALDPMSETYRRALERLEPEQ